MQRPRARLRVRTTLVLTSVLALVGGVLGSVVSAPAALADASPESITLTSGSGLSPGNEDPSIQYAVQDGGPTGNAVVMDTSVSPCAAYGTIPSSSAQFVTAGTPGNGCYNSDGSSTGAANETLTTTYSTPFTLPGAYSAVDISVHYLADNWTTVSLNNNLIDDSQPAANDMGNFDGSTDWTATSSDASNFQPGDNTLSFDVTDISQGDSISPTGVAFEATITYTPAPDLAITKTADHNNSGNPVIAGNRLVYTVAVSNNGSADASNVQITDSLPNTGAASDPRFCEVISPNPSCDTTGGTAYDSSTAIPAIATLATGETKTFQIGYEVDPSTPAGTQDNTATVSSDTTESVVANSNDDNTSTNTVGVITRSNLSFTEKSAVGSDVTPACAGPTGTLVFANATACQNTVTFTIKVTNGGPSDAQNVTAAINTINPATGEPLQNFTGCTVVADRCTSAGVTIADGGDHTFTITAHAKDTLRGGETNNFTKNAYVSSDTPDINAVSFPKSGATNLITVHTVPDQVSDTTYDVQAGNANAVVSWTPLTASQNGGETVDYYQLGVSASPSGSGTGTVNVYPPSPTPPAGSKVATPCAGRLGGTLCFNLTGLSNSTTIPPAAPSVQYTVTIKAHNAVGLATPRTRTGIVPSPNNSAVIVPPATAQTLTTCDPATTAHPICIKYSVPSGGGGAFSTAGVTAAVSQCTSLGGTATNCAGMGGTSGLGSFEGHPPAGYTKTNPLMIQITWDVSTGVKQTDTIYYQVDGSQPKPLAACKKGGVANPDPCLKAIKTLGKSADTTKTCKPQSSCFGDVQAQVLLSSNPVDGGLYRKP